MPQGVSIHIGLNNVDPAAYDGWNGQLYGCLNDAAAMQDIAVANGFNPVMLKDGAATSDAVIQEIGRAALDLIAGDTCLITYSGHGGQVPDANGDEADGQDEAWVLFDRMLLDDELYQVWGQFAAGVRVVVVSDSCHSGSILRPVPPKPEWAALYANPYATPHSGPRAAGTKDTASGPRPKIIPLNVQQAHCQQHAMLYRTRQMAAARGKRATVEASLILLSGCQDNQLSADGATNGLFTENLLAVWGNGLYSGGYRAFLDEIVTRMPQVQTPNFDTAGEPDPDFADARPFSLGRGVSATPGAPTNGIPSHGTTPPPVGKLVSGPSQCSASGGPPTLQVKPAPNVYYVVELATDPALFDRTANGDQRTSDNFYGSWQDTPRQTAGTYHIPAAVWGRLKAAGRMYYRVVTAAGATGWANCVKSSEDNDPAPPSIQVTAAPSSGTGGPPPARSGVKQYSGRPKAAHS